MNLLLKRVFQMCYTRITVRCYFDALHKILANLLLLSNIPSIKRLQLKTSRRDQWTLNSPPALLLRSNARPE